MHAAFEIIWRGLNFSLSSGFRFQRDSHLLPLMTSFIPFMAVKNIFQRIILYSIFYTAPYCLIYSPAKFPYSDHLFYSSPLETFPWNCHGEFFVLRWFYCLLSQLPPFLSRITCNFTSFAPLILAFPVIVWDYRSCIQTCLSTKTGKCTHLFTLTQI